MVFLSGTGFSREPNTGTMMAAVEWAQADGAAVMLDLDYRPTPWDDPRAYGPMLRRIVAGVDLAVGIEEEIKAAAGEADVAVAMARLLEVGRNLRALIVKRALATKGPALIEVMVDRDIKHGVTSTGWWDMPIPEYLRERRAVNERERGEEVIG